MTGLLFQPQKQFPTLTSGVEGSASLPPLKIRSDLEYHPGRPQGYKPLSGLGRDQGSTSLAREYSVEHTCSLFPGVPGVPGAPYRLLEGSRGSLVCHASHQTGKKWVQGLQILNPMYIPSPLSGAFPHWKTPGCLPS